MSRKMYGVVLWADQTDNQAVVWCEDHGDLAYWHDTGSPQHEGPCLDAGDLIQFELMQDRNLRYVRNPERVMQQHFAGLAGRLKTARGAVARPSDARDRGTTVLAFPARRRAPLSV
ncbi:hypothetical protein ACFSDD_09510 [Salipiger marinus]|jgi:hypothetical protein|uniref:hypothetical protein n=1 Tax=Salipiger marinus TaxID=555512 RepID=UPI001E3CC0B8|nr:hypothetical protein [Salipiger manganoxidans]MCD1620062.1 hypothetical protein [Salipiger manganoxidans]MEB3420406.1 hypothetical protein [Salipiger manganoxidans]